MTDRANIIADALGLALPEFDVMVDRYNKTPPPVTCNGRAVVLVTDSGDQDMLLNVYAEEDEDIGKLTADVYRAIGNDLTLDGKSFEMKFYEGRPILDESDYRVGESLRYTAELRPAAVPAEAPASMAAQHAA